MTDRETLVELLWKYDQMRMMRMNIEECVDHLIANGVTVGKPLTEHLHPLDAYEGLKGKYLVFKADTGEQIVNCFVLRPEKDTAAVEALRTYASTTNNETLAMDIYNWVGQGETAQRWIPVTERLPEVNTDVTVYTIEGYIGTDFRTTNGNWFWNDELPVTHWMPLPKPPKEVDHDS